MQQQASTDNNTVTCREFGTYRDAEVRFDHSMSFDFFFFFYLLWFCSTVMVMVMQLLCCCFLYRRGCCCLKVIKSFGFLLHSSSRRWNRRWQTATAGVYCKQTICFSSYRPGYVFVGEIQQVVNLEYVYKGGAAGSRYIRARGDQQRFLLLSQLRTLKCRQSSCW
jgi:hypothetical protein